MYDKIYRDDVLWTRIRRRQINGGATGVNGLTFDDIEAYGVMKWLSELTDYYEIQLLGVASNVFRKLPANYRTGALFKQIAASPALKPEPIKWHQRVIRLQGRHLQVSIDGQQVIDGQVPQDIQARGHIGLQLYPKEVQLRIKDLGGFN